MARKEFEMSDEQLDDIRDAGRVSPYMVIGGITPLSSAWETLGQKMGFKHMTVRPIAGKGLKHFTAETDGVWGEIEPTQQ